jgi:hypothetical protein
MGTYVFLILGSLILGMLLMNSVSEFHRKQIITSLVKETTREILSKISGLQEPEQTKPYDPTDLLEIYLRSKNRVEKLRRLEELYSLCEGCPRNPLNHPPVSKRIEQPPCQEFYPKDKNNV